MSDISPSLHPELCQPDAGAGWRRVQRFFSLWPKAGLVALLLAWLIASPGDAFGQAATASSTTTASSSAGGNSNLRITIDDGKGDAGKGTSMSMPLQLFFIFTVLSLVPSILVMTTSFVRILIVFSFLRQALTVSQPPNQVLLALALFLSAVIMAPTFKTINQKALEPMRAGTMTFEQGAEVAAQEMKGFMLRYTREKELKLFLELSPEKLQPASPEDVPLQIVIPAFMLSELKTGFQMGLLIMLPFLVIDLVVSSVLMALGMMMLPPPIIALPLKLMIFVLVDGWTLIVKSIVMSFQ